MTGRVGGILKEQIGNLGKKWKLLVILKVPWSRRLLPWTKGTLTVKSQCEGKAEADRETGAPSEGEVTPSEKDYS